MNRPSSAAGGVPAELVSSPVIRAALASRAAADPTPAPWRNAAAAAGVTGADAYLRHLMREISAALISLRADSEAARVELCSLRASLHAAVDSRCDELEARLETEEITKKTALEHELCAVDVALERLHAKRSAAADAATSLDDVALVAQHADLTARLDDAEADLLTLPTSVIESPRIALDADAPALMAEIAAFGRVVSPRAVTAADLALEGAPDVAFPGKPVSACLVLQGPAHAAQSADELRVSLAAAAAATHIEATLEASGVASQLLPVTLKVDLHWRRVFISIAIPTTARQESSVCVAVSVFGRPLAGAPPPHLRIPVRRHPRVRFAWPAYDGVPLSLCISPAGHIFVPVCSSPYVHVYDSDGSSLPGLLVSELSLSSSTCMAAFSDDADPLLLLADDCGVSSRVVALDPATRTVRWATAPGIMDGCGGLAALPGQNSVVVLSIDSVTLFSHRLSDGERTGSLSVPGLSDDLAADSVSGTLFGAMSREGHGVAVCRFVWDPSVGLKADGFVEAAAGSVDFRLLAVVPPASGGGVSYLVVGSMNAPELLVIALPSLTLVHTHRLAGMQVTALAADPWGEALAVSDRASGAVHVLAWPLPGMPALE